MPAERVIRSLDQVIEWRGKPQAIRCDNGPEYMSEKLRTWAEKRNITLQYIQPGNPQQNAYVERYNRTVRYDWLTQYLFDTVAEVQDYATRWLWLYNNERPNMAIGGITPKQKLAMAA
ncbi:Integrase core domain-containing protein [Desulfuromusa kysingii]|uniref:Integrase core domain-containing protein n=1 Tax=Desulfuromusa kysingii TaxID=37625 RepID=A0A1H3YZ74_9BACT|nr:Integrase core domain-containing protein [Desulfuromusa kysingii]